LFTFKINKEIETFQSKDINFSESVLTTESRLRNAEQRINTLLARPHNVIMHNILWPVFVTYFMS